ncbi:hypothetical protein ACTXJ9_03220 [Brachybacterium tyrofermentans]|uniref:hypothetical protein n=1 Tax=Brachybacterium tyrofermentans TaxID=47848 RepID=UPI003FD34945
MSANHALESVTTTIGTEVNHEVGFAVMAGPKVGLGFAVVDQATSEIIAWDGWYSLPDLSPQDLTPLDEMDDWIDRDDMASKMVLARSAKWLAVLAEWLCPHYSFTKLSKSITESHGHHGESDLRGGWSVVAYYPTSLPVAEAREAAAA